MSSAASFAKQNGYNLNDLLNHTSYGKACRLHTKHFDKMSKGVPLVPGYRNLAEMRYLDDEMAVINLDLELLTLAENRRSKEMEDIRSITEAYYHRLRAESPGIVLPPLTTFQQLPIIRSLLSLANHEIKRSMQDLLETGVVRSELAKWESEARNQMATVLGYHGFATAQKKTLHPADRLTAWFQCKKCIQVGRRLPGATFLDFAGACAHECGGVDGKELDNELWTATNFVRDEKVRKNRQPLPLFIHCLEGNCSC